MSEIVVKSNGNILYRCVNCRSKKIHCVGGGKQGQPVEMLKDRCSDKECQCRCKTHYEANNGRLRRYGTIDTTSANEDLSPDRKHNASDDLIDEINAQYQKNRAATKVVKKQ